MSPKKIVGIVAVTLALTVLSLVLFMSVTDEEVRSYVDRYHTSGETFDRTTVSSVVVETERIAKESNDTDADYSSTTPGSSTNAPAADFVEEGHDAPANNTIYVDAGHGCKYTTAATAGKYGWAAEGAKEEPEWNYDFSREVGKALSAAGYTVLYITDLTYDNVKVLREEFGNSGRTNAYIDSDASMMIQIHYDDWGDPSKIGGHVIYGTASSGSKDLAVYIQDAMAANGCNINPDAINERNELQCYQIKTDKPLILFEAGFGVKGKTEYDLLRDVKYRKKLVTSIVEGVNKYYGK